MRLVLETGANGVDRAAPAAARAGTPAPHLLRTADIDQVLALQQAVVRAAPPGRVRERSAPALAGYLDASRGLAYGIASLDVAGALDAVGLLHLPCAAMPNHAPGMPRIPVREWALESALLMGGMVRPGRRGLGLQRTLIEYRRRAAAAVGMRWICAGVPLSQVASTCNLLRSGFVLTGSRVDSVGPVVALAASADGCAVATDASDPVWVGLDDAASIARLCADGYAGVRVTLDALQFERLIPSLTLLPAGSSRANQ